MSSKEGGEELLIQDATVYPIVVACWGVLTGGDD